MILARSTRLNQPSATVEIDPTNPLSHGLVGNINPAARNFQSVGAVAFKSTEGGVALLGTGASFAFKNVPLFGNGATLLFVGNWLNGGSHVAAIGNSGTGDQCFIFQAGATGTSRPRALIRTVNGGGITTAETLGSGNDTQYDQIEVWCARYDGTTALKLYRNGNDFTGGNANTSASGSISTLNNISLGGTNRGSDAFASSGQRQVLGLYWSRALSPAEIKEISRNPWQIFKPVQRRIYFDMGAGGGVTLTGANCAQSNTSTSGSISQTHSLSGASVAQSNTSTTGAIGQSIILTGASVSQGNASTSGAVSQTHVLIGANCQQANTSTSGAVVQTGDLTGANCAQVNTSSNGSISQTHVLSGASCTQPNTTTSGAVIIVSGVILTGANCAQGNTTTTGAISQSHVLIGAPVAIDHIATASSIVQTHILSGADCSQSNYSTTGSINQVVIPSQFVASVPAGVFSASVPSEKFSAAVPGGNQ